MKRASQDKAIVTGEDGEFVGIILGYDYCAEHEWGIKDLQRMLGIRDATLNLYTKVNTESTRVVLHRFNWKGEEYVSLGTKGWRDSENEVDLSTDEKVKNHFYYAHMFDHDCQKNEFFSAWSGESFLIVVDKKYHALVEELYEGFKDNNIIVTLQGSNNPFGGTGLMFALASKIPESVYQESEEAQKEKERLLKAVEETGIEERLKKANKRYFALSPRFVEEEGKEVIRFWLNPYEQHSNNFGWYSVEQLDQWIKDEGPIPKNKKGAKA